jgi:hypothetical protein
MRIRMSLHPNPSFQKKAQTLEKVLKQAHVPYILAYRLQTDADPGCQNDADPCECGS